MYNLNYIHHAVLHDKKWKYRMTFYRVISFVTRCRPSLSVTVIFWGPPFEVCPHPVKLQVPNEDILVVFITPCESSALITKHIQCAVITNFRIFVPPYYFYNFCEKFFATWNLISMYSFPFKLNAILDHLPTVKKQTALVHRRLEGLFGCVS